MYLTVSTVLIWMVYIISMFFLTFWLLTFLEKGLGDEERKLMRFPMVTVTLPAKNEEKGLEETAKSVMALDYPKDKIEMIIVNDGSTDRTLDIAKKIQKEHKEYSISIISHAVNQGKGRSLNDALKTAKGEFFVCLDADSVIDSDALHKMLPVFDNEKVATVLPLMKVKNPKGIIGKMQWCEYLINLFYKGIMGKVDCVHVSPGPFSLYRRSVLEKIGGFSETHMTEDMEITLRIQKFHYKIVQLLNTSVYTRVPTTWKGLYRQRNRWYKGTMFTLKDHKDMIMNKSYGDFGMIQLPRVLMSGFLAVFVLFLVGYHIVRPLARWIYDISFVGFSWSHFVSSWQVRIANFALLDINYTYLIFGGISLTLALLILKLSFRYTKERYTNQGWVSVPLYLILYGTIASGIWLGVFIDLIFGRKQKW